jgi:hypothetical protein
VALVVLGTVGIALTLPGLQTAAVATAPVGPTVGVRGAGPTAVVLTGLAIGAVGGGPAVSRDGLTAARAALLALATVGIGAALLAQAVEAELSLLAVLVAVALRVLGTARAQTERDGSTATKHECGSICHGVLLVT